MTTINIMLLGLDTADFTANQIECGRDENLLRRTINVIVTWQSWTQ